MLTRTLRITALAALVAGTVTVGSMHAAGADWYLTEYAGALHAFTIWGMDMPGMAKYNEAADQRSWRAMQDFFGELWG